MPAASTELADGDFRFDVATGDALLRWYETERRDLPWRRTQDPYAILVSEVMLQQTRVETVMPRYARFLERFPTAEALADADLDEVLAEWSGLGYYRRARSLHAAAQAVSDLGSFPRDFETIRSLPGVGDYTAAAVAGIAFGEPHVGIDGNVSRVLCRYFGITHDPTRAATRRTLRAAAESLLPGRPPGDVTQSLMELGARVCTPRSPRCDSCPIRANCVARDEGTQELLPVRRQQKIYDVLEAALAVERDGKVLLVRGQREGVLAEMWEFPTLDSRGAAAITADTPEDARQGQLRDYVRAQGIDAASLRPLGTIRHGITNRRITCEVYRGETDAATPSAGPNLRWVTPAEAAQMPLAASAARILALLADA